MGRYLVTTKSDAYEGKVLGIKFNNGQALVDDAIVPKNLGRDADEIAHLMKEDFGYTVKRLDKTETEPKKMGRFQKGNTAAVKKKVEEPEITPNTTAVSTV